MHALKKTLHLEGLFRGGLCITVAHGGTEWYTMCVWWEIVVDYESSLTVSSFINHSHADWRVHTQY